MADQVAQEPGKLFKFNRPQPGSPPISQLMQDLFKAIARNNWTTDDKFPLDANSDDGMFRVLAADMNNVKVQVSVSGAWHTFLQNVQNGIAAPAKKIVEINTGIGDVWTIDHNLGSQPLVQVFNSSYIQRQVVPATPGANQYILQHASPNRVVITHPGASNPTGFVVLIG